MKRSKMNFSSHMALILDDFQCFIRVNPIGTNHGELMVISYAYVRVSSKEQNPERQIEAIKEYCPDIQPERIFVDKQSGKTFERKYYQILKNILENVAETLREGDSLQLILEEVDRLGRNARQIKKELAWFQKMGIAVRILELPTTLIDLKENKWVFEMATNILIEVYASIAQQENEKRAKRQAEGIAIAKTKGIYKGRKPLEIDEETFDKVYRKWQLGEITAQKAMELLGLTKSTFYRRVKIRKSRKYTKSTETVTEIRQYQTEKTASLG